jgi:hypothetical protein
MKKYNDTLFAPAPLPNGKMIDKEFTQKRTHQPHSVQDIFDKLGEHIVQDDSNCMEEIKQTMGVLFPLLKSQ